MLYTSLADVNFSFTHMYPHSLIKAFHTTLLTSHFKIHEIFQIQLTNFLIFNITLVGLLDELLLKRFFVRRIGVPTSGI